MPPPSTIAATAGSSTTARASSWSSHRLPANHRPAAQGVRHVGARRKRGMCHRRRSCGSRCKAPHRWPGFSSPRRRWSPNCRRKSQRLRCPAAVAWAVWAAWISRPIRGLVSEMKARVNHPGFARVTPVPQQGSGLSYMSSSGPSRALLATADVPAAGRGTGFARKCLSCGRVPGSLSLRRALDKPPLDALCTRGSPSRPPLPALR